MPKLTDDILIIVGGCAVLFLMFVLPPTGWILPDLCWFHRLTGFPCAGCGLTRSFLALGKLDIRTSIRYHMFGIGFFILMLGWMASAVWILAAPSSAPHMKEFQRKVLMPILMVLIVLSLIRWGIGIIRFIPAAR